MLLFEEIEKPYASGAVIMLPARITPASLASIVKLPWRIRGSSLVRKIVSGAAGGKTEGSKVMLSPDNALPMASRRLPEPLSDVLVTTKVVPGCKAIDVGDQAVVVFVDTLKTNTYKITTLSFFIMSSILF